jgi:uncharacterized protein with HEPN domain
MTNVVKKRLLDALLACRAIREFTKGLDFSAYEDDLLVRSGVERQFEIVGEALNKAADDDASLLVRLPDLRRIVGLRNRLIHGYDTVDDEIIWDIVQTKLPALEEHLSALLARGELDDEGIESSS